MKVFYAEGYDRGSCRCGQCGPDFAASATVVANTDSEALGLVLEKWPESKAQHWTLTEVDCSKVGVLDHDG